MKCFVLTFSLIFTGFSLLLGATEFPCDDYISTTNSDALLDQMTAYLTSGTWVEELNDQKEIVHFLENGSVQIINYTSSDATHIKSGLWEARLDESGNPYFYMSHQSGRSSKAYNIYLSCGQFEIVDHDNQDRRTLKYEKSTQQLSAITQGLIGQWENTSYANDDDTKYLNYSLNAQGEYSSKVQLEGYCTDEMGTWTMSKDGKYLFLSPEEGTPTVVVRLKYLEGDEMVLEFATLIIDSEIQQFKNLFFGKI